MGGVRGVRHQGSPTVPIYFRVVRIMRILSSDPDSTKVARELRAGRITLVSLPLLPTLSLSSFLSLRQRTMVEAPFSMEARYCGDTDDRSSKTKKKSELSLPMPSTLSQYLISFATLNFPATSQISRKEIAWM